MNKEQQQAYDEATKEMDELGKWLEANPVLVEVTRHKCAGIVALLLSRFTSANPIAMLLRESLSSIGMALYLAGYYANKEHGASAPIPRAFLDM